MTNRLQYTDAYVFHKSDLLELSRRKYNLYPRTEFSKLKPVHHLLVSVMVKNIHSYKSWEANKF